MAFAQLDTEMSKAKIVLLVQIGKEGWDCRSLSGVILSQKGDCPKNMTLQTACRCLREAVFHENETGLILLNDHNWKTLNAQLQEEQHTTIEQLNKAKTEDVPMRERVSRMDFLNLPNTIEYFKVKLKDAEVVDIAKEDPSVSLAFLLEKLKNNTSFAVSNVREGNFDAETITHFISEYGSEQAVYNNWLLQLMRHSLGVLDLKTLQPHFDVLKAIFTTTTYVENNVRYWNANFDIKDVNKQIRLAFIPQKTIEYAIETVPHTAEWLKIGNLTPVEEADTLFPKKQEQEQILNLDADGKDATDITPEMIKNAQRIVDTFRDMGVTKTLDDVLKDAPVSKILKNKKRTLHYTPYNFLQSNFERQLVEETLKFDLLAQHNIELYFNGDRAVSNFQIECFDKNPSGRYVRIGNYTPDFLMIQRKKGSDEIERLLIIETKGGIYGHDFKRKRRFMEEDFVNENEKRFNFRKFEFLYLEDSEPITQNIAKLQNTIKTFFI